MGILIIISLTEDDLQLQYRIVLIMYIYECFYLCVFNKCFYENFLVCFIESLLLNSTHIFLIEKYALVSLDNILISTHSKNISGNGNPTHGRMYRQTNRERNRRTKYFSTL